MNQEKIGCFIAQCRKGEGLTQVQLAEKFGISNRAVSKWEIGKSCPDPSIMIELCNFLGISVNELLSGEKIADTDAYQVSVENNILEMQKQLAAYKRRIVMNNIFLMIVAVVGALEAPWTLIFIGFVILFRNYYLLENMKSVKKMIEHTTKS